MNFVATKRPIGHGHSIPPDSFLETLVAWAKNANLGLFQPNPYHDIYAVLEPVLGPWQGMEHRRSVMCEALRVLAGDESDWNWNEGRDTTAGPETPAQMEAGAFQVSYDSRSIDPSLGAYLLGVGIFDAYEFQQRIKADPVLDCAYAARLLRYSTRWDGPINRGWVTAQVSRDAVEEFMALIASK